MLQLYDITHKKIAGLPNYKDYNIQREINQLDILSFLYPVIDVNSNSLQEECYISTKDNEYVIKEVNTQDDDWIQYVCKVNIEGIQGTSVSHFETVEQSCSDSINLALAGTGWTIGFCDVTKLRTVRKSNCNAYDVLKEIQNAFGCEMTFDAVNKKVNIYQAMGTDKGTYFAEQLNLKKLTVQRNSYDYITRLIPIGKDGLQINDINGGKEYVENFQYSNKIITAYWEDNRYTVVEALLEDATAKLDYLSKPYKAYKADVFDLANANDVYKNILDYSLGDTITLMAKSKNTKEKQRIVKLTEYPEEPERNTCDIANKIVSLDVLNARFSDTSDTVDSVTTSNGGIDGSKVDAIDWNKLQNVHIMIADIQDMSVVTARIGTLEATTATITQLNALQANINDLTANKASITDLTAATGRISTLEANSASITQLNAQIARIDTLTATTAHITNGIIDNATIDVAKVNNLSANYATIVNLNAATGNITTLQSQVASINNLLAGNIGASNLAAGAIQAGSAVISNSAISSAQIISLDVAKINAGNISTTKFRVVSDAGNLLISDNTIQIKDASRVRVQIGKDASNDYNMYVWDASGNLMFDALGLKASGIKGKIIVDNMVSDTANIDAKKLNITSLFTQMNGSTQTLKATKIYLDTQAQTLDVAFTSLSSTVTTQGNTISSQGTSITTIQGQISSKVWSTDITTAVNNVQVGGTNLLRNADFRSLSYWNGYDAINNNDYLNKNSLTLSRTNYVSGNGRKQLNSTIQSFPVLDIGSSYTVSAWIYVDSSVALDGSPNNNLVIRVYNADASYNDYGSIDLTLIAKDKWVYVSKSFSLAKIASLATNKPALLLSINQNGLMKICMPKLEIGTRATYFTVAPEDTQAQIDATNTNISTNYSTTTQTNSLISAQVSSVSTDLHTNYSTTTAMNTAITTSSNGVLSTVSSTYATQSSLDTTNANVTTAQNTANSKRRIFTAQPTVPYDVGDLWISTTTSGNNMICTTARTTGSYTASDWVKDSVTQRMTSAESSISQNAGNIALKVNTIDFNGNNIASIINQSATTIKLSASKIDLSGYVTITALGIAGSTTINGSNIKGGTLTLGGSGNGNGLLTINNASGSSVGWINNNGITLNQGAFSISSYIGSDSSTFNVSNNKLNFYHSAPIDANNWGTDTSWISGSAFYLERSQSGSFNAIASINLSCTIQNYTESVGITTVGTVNWNTNGARININGMPLPANSAIGTQDLNTVVNSGFYRMDSGNANSPSGTGYGQLIVAHGAYDTILQIASDYSSSNMYWRSGSPSQVGGGGSWGAWRRLLWDGMSYGYLYNLYTDHIYGATNLEQIGLGSAGACRIDTTGGTARFQASSSNYISIDGNSFSVYIGGTTRFAVSSTGTKTGGTIDIDGTTYGMAPIDCPRQVIEDFYLNKWVDSEGTTIQLDVIYSKSISEYGVFPSNGDAKCISKGPNSFTIKGYTGVIDIRVVGYRKDSLDYRYPIMNSMVAQGNICLHCIN